MPIMPAPVEFSSYLRLPPTMVGLGLIAGAGPSRGRGTKGTGVLGRAWLGSMGRCDISGAPMGPISAGPIMCPPP